MKTHTFKVQELFFFFFFLSLPQHKPKPKPSPSLATPHAIASPVLSRSFTFHTQNSKPHLPNSLKVHKFPKIFDPLLLPKSTTSPPITTDFNRCSIAWKAEEDGEA